MDSKDISIGLELDILSGKIYSLSMEMMNNPEGQYELFYPDLIEMSQRLESMSKHIFECVEELIEEGEFDGR